MTRGAHVAHGRSSRRSGVVTKMGRPLLSAVSLLRSAISVRVLIIPCGASRNSENSWRARVTARMTDLTAVAEEGDLDARLAKCREVRGDAVAVEVSEQREETVGEDVCVTADDALDGFDLEAHITTPAAVEVDVGREGWPGRGGPHQHFGGDLGVGRADGLGERCAVGRRGWGGADSQPGGGFGQCAPAGRCRSTVPPSCSSTVQAGGWCWAWG